MVAIMLAGVMFPLWPVKLRIGVWYLSILALGLLGALIVLAIVRLIFWCITVVVAPKAIWMFPNLFEDVGFVSFAPHVDSEVEKITLTCSLTLSSPSGRMMSQRRRRRRSRETVAASDHRVEPLGKNRKSWRAKEKVLLRKSMPLRAD